MARLRCPEKKNRTGGQKTVDSGWCESHCDKASTCEALAKKLKRTPARKQKENQSNQPMIIINRYGDPVLRACARCLEEVDELDSYCHKCGLKMK